MADSRDIQPEGQVHSASFLPNFCSIRVVFAVVITAELLAIVLALVSVHDFDVFYVELSVYSLYIQWISLMSVALLCVLRMQLNKLRDSLAGVIAWLLVLLVTLGVAWLSQVFLSPISVDYEVDWTSIIKNLIISGIVSALVLRYFYIQHLWRRQVVAESRSRFQALQSRIRPHFLFNSMNTIAHLTRSNPKLAETVVEDLSELFRASLSDSRKKSTLGDELELCRHYLRIEGERLGERLQVEWDIDDLPLEAPLPSLILQPLLENAVYHGVKPASDPGLIQVCGRYRRQQVNLSIRNTVPGSPTQRHREGNRMALENTRQRLEGFFAGEADLTLSKVDGDHQVRVVFPYPWNE
ncbi:sensor histidine kinase [Solemya velesiana gill symbiont]|uniref:Histidine kinase n=1 Tax=Solemya velesiana gill symbiont TaxID=1918948 RepID=A0A1T2KUS4_9GAMM|nr:histidine kinase [Solemya velesiana gill symbiont]OOZ36574.1 histidine kinase [Solemya velesiana gill symbiont]